MSELQLGKLITDEQHRDAIHIAVAPVTAGDNLSPGAPVGFLPNGNVGCVATPIGIVDPFLSETVRPNERFWLFLLPNTVTGMRHHWQHPAFSDDMPTSGKDRSASEQWIRDFAERIDQTYEDLMRAAGAFVASGHYTYDNSEGYKNEWGAFPEFWEHYEDVTGTTVSDDTKESTPFTCSC